MSYPRGMFLENASRGRKFHALPDRCGQTFLGADAYDLHRPDGKCLSPPTVGLVVARQARRGSRPDNSAPRGDPSARRAATCDAFATPYYEATTLADVTRGFSCPTPDRLCR